MNIIPIRMLNRPLLCHLKELSGKRALFTQDSLGITAYAANRELEFTYTAHPEKFKDEFRQKVEHTVPLNLLVDNLKRYVHVFNPNLNEMELLWKALRLFKTQSDQWQRKSQLDKKKVYIFGPIVMRALAYHDVPEYAIKFFDDSNITDIFDQLISYQILLDLLYDRKMYGDVLRINDEIQRRIAAQNRYASSAMNAIIFATYYRLNTPTHDELAYDMYKVLKSCDNHTKQYRKSIALVAAMRLKCHQPNESLEILSIYDDIDVNIRYVRILSYTHLNQFDQVFRLLGMTLTTTANNQPVPKIPDQLLQKVERKLKKTGDGRLMEQYTSIFSELKRLDRILFKSLDDVLCARFPTKMAPYKPTKTFDHGNI